MSLISGYFKYFLFFPQKKIVENSVVSEQGTVPCGSWKCHMTMWLRGLAKSSLAAKPVQNSAFLQTVYLMLQVELQQILRCVHV